MAGRLGIRADIILNEAVLGRILETMDSMLIEKQQAGIVLSGSTQSDDGGDYTLITAIGEDSPVGICVASSEGGTEPTDEELGLFKSILSEGILMKVDVYAHQFSFYAVGDTVEDATVLFSERSDPNRVPVAHLLFGDAFLLHDVAYDTFEEQVGRILEDRSQRSDSAGLIIVDRFQGYDDIGRICQIAVVAAGYRDDLGSDLLGDLRGLYHRRGPSGVRYQEREVILGDDRCGHLSDEVDIEPELN